MKGDFSRFTFDPSKHYAGVMHQQGRLADSTERRRVGASRSFTETVNRYHWPIRRALARYSISTLTEYRSQQPG
jgi:hypothetical protein